MSHTHCSLHEFVALLKNVSDENTAKVNDALADFDNADLVMMASALQSVAQAREKESVRQRVLDACKTVGLPLESFVLVANEELNAYKANRRRRKKASVVVHPSDSKLSWSGRGRKPAWLKQLEAQERKAKE